MFPAAPPGPVLPTTAELTAGGMRESVQVFHRDHFGGFHFMRMLLDDEINGPDPIDRIAIDRALSWWTPLKNGLDGLTERVGNAKAQLERRRVTSRFQRDDGLPGHAAGIRQRLLGHLTVLETQTANLVGDRCTAHAGTARRSRQYSQAVTA